MLLTLNYNAQTVHLHAQLYGPLQVYAVALYVEAEPAANELGIRHRGGFFQDNR